MEKKYTFDEFIQIIAKLRAEDGCPWDKVQTHESLRECMLEEAYEVVEAINQKDAENLCEELGDVLMQVVFHAGIAKEKKQFAIEDVIDGIARKMIRRHPHIFSNVIAETPEAVLDNWEEIKKEEKQIQTITETIKTVPKALPALIRAQKVQKKAAAVGFDFPDVLEALKKLQEETTEFSNAVQEQDGSAEEEFGDILFSMVNIARFLKINPEFALTKTVEKFINRFEYVEKAVTSQEGEFSSYSLEALDRLWEAAKKAGY